MMERERELVEDKWSVIYDEVVKDVVHFINSLEAHCLLPYMMLLMLSLDFPTTIEVWNFRGLRENVIFNYILNWLQ
jgi:hypothetical protein